MNFYGSGMIWLWISWDFLGFYTHKADTPWGNNGLGAMPEMSTRSSSDQDGSELWSSQCDGAESGRVLSRGVGWELVAIGGWVVGFLGGWPWRKIPSAISHRIHGAAIYGNMDMFNISQMWAYIP